MGLILDTSVLIAAERRRLDLAAFFASHPTEIFFLAAVSAAELLHGVARADTPARRRPRSRFVEDVLSRIETLDYDLGVAREHSRLWAALEKAGLVIGPYDLIIAATAKHHRYGLATLNADEFRRVPGLRVIVPKNTP
jgi:tRNA(fMet)-specific endonuclease VapC